MDKKPRRKSSIKIEISHDAKKDGKGTFTRKKSVAGDEMSFIRRKKLAESEGGFSTLTRRKKSLAFPTSKSEQSEVHSSHSMFDFSSASASRALSDIHSSRVWSSDSLYVRESMANPGTPFTKRQGGGGGQLSKFKGKTASLFSPKQKRPERRGSLDAIGEHSLENVHEATTIPNMVFLRGEVNVKRSKSKMVKKWLVVTVSEIRCYDSHEESQDTMSVLCTFGTLSYVDLGVVLPDYVILLHQITGKETFLSFGSMEAASIWAIAIDTVMCNNFLRRAIPLSSREELISVEVAKTAKGGVLKRVAEEDEEWQYQDNVLTYNHGSQPQKFEWDGFTLKELKSKVDDSCLIGHWDGGVIRIRKGETLLMQFIYIPDTREYLNVEEGEAKSWKWSRHFLASKSGKGSAWLVEGAIPEPVVMILQGFRYACGKDDA